MKHALALVLMVFGIVGCSIAEDILLDPLTSSDEFFASELSTKSDYLICDAKFTKRPIWRTDEHIYRRHKMILHEFNSRQPRRSCKIFKTIPVQDEWMVAWVSEYELKNNNQAVPSA